MTDDPAVEAVARHLYLTTDTDWDHRVVKWRNLDEDTYPGERDRYRAAARRIVRVVDKARACEPPPSS